MIVAIARRPNKQLAKLAVSADPLANWGQVPSYFLPSASHGLVGDTNIGGDSPIRLFRIRGNRPRMPPQAFVVIDHRRAPSTKQNDGHERTQTTMLRSANSPPSRRAR
jgi:hypothetical protein